MATRTTVQITMPQMGESVTEGTILEWLKQVGDEIARDEGVVEISTDKVDTEVPAPAAGTLTTIAVQPDETVPVGTVLGEIETDGDGDVTAAGNGGAPENSDPDARPTAPGDGGAAEEAAAQAPGEFGSDSERQGPTGVTDADADVVELEMPQMGESVTEGTILEWLKQVGDEVERDEGVVEVSTDKVDTEVPAPATGRIVEILVQSDETVPVGTPMCRIALAAGARTGGRDGAGTAPAGLPAPDQATADEDGQPLPVASEDAPATPVAQRIAAAHGIDLASVSGSGPAAA